MNENLLKTATIIKNIVEEKKVIIVIDCDDNYTHRDFDEIANDVGSYLDYISILEIYNILLEHSADFNNIEEAINFIVKDFNTSSIKITCNLPQKLNYDLTKEEINIDDDEIPSKMLIGTIGLFTVFFIYLIYKLFFNH